MDTSLISDIGDKKVEAHQHAKLRRIASQKLMEKGNYKRFRYIFFWPIGTSVWVIGFTIGFINHMIRLFKDKE